MNLLFAEGATAPAGGEKGIGSRDESIRSRIERYNSKDEATDEVNGFML